MAPRVPATAALGMEARRCWQAATRRTGDVRQRSSKGSQSATFAAALGMEARQAKRRYAPLSSVLSAFWRSNATMGVKRPRRAGAGTGRTALGFSSNFVLGVTRRCATHRSRDVARAEEHYLVHAPAGRRRLWQPSASALPAPPAPSRALCQRWPANVHLGHPHNP